MLRQGNANRGSGLHIGDSLYSKRVHRCGSRRGRSPFPPDMSPGDRTAPGSTASATTLTFGRSRIEYLSEQIVDDRLEDIGQGADTTPEKLRSFHDTKVPSVRTVNKECMDLTARYANLPGAKLKLVDATRIPYGRAESWCV